MTRDRRRAKAGRRAAAFTLIELMAVLLILGLLAAIALPNFGLRAARVLEGESRKLATSLEFVRQRAVMTGVPHRMTFDLERMAYWTEWYVSESQASGEEEPPFPLGPEEIRPDTPIDLSPPRNEEPAWRRLLGTAGNVERLDELVFIDGIETAGGYVDRGELELLFERDGTTDPTWIVISDDGGNSITLAVAPLADTVRFEYGNL